MYLPAHFQEQRPDILQALMQARPLATLLTSSAAGLAADHLPLLFLPQQSGPGLLRGHIARANPLWSAGASPQPALAIFHGPQAYVSPAYYPAKKDHGRVVPTWNYVAVHAHGHLRLIDDKNWLGDFLDQLTAHHEATQAQPWQMADAPPDYLERMLAAVIGVELEIERLEGKYKLSQNQNEANRAGVLGAFHQSAQPEENALADFMQG